MPLHLAWLSAVVVLAHYALLSGSVDVFGAPSGAGAASFNTRSIPAPAAVQTAAIAAPATAAIAPRTATAAPAPRPRKPKPAPPVAEPKVPPAPEAASPSPPAQQNSEPNQPIAPESTAQAATETVAIATPTVEPTALPTSTETAPSTPAYLLGPLAIPASKRLAFDVKAQAKGLPYSASADLFWRQDGTQYELRQEVSALFLGRRVDHSAGQIGPHGISPTRYVRKTRKEEAAHFESNKGQITFSNNRPQAAWQSGSQDQLSLAMQLAAMFAGAADKYPEGSRIRIQVAGVSDAEVWVFQVGAEEQTEVPAGALRAIKLTREPRREFDRRVEFWLAPSLGYLPARMKITEPNGDFVENLLRESTTP